VTRPAHARFLAFEELDEVATPALAEAAPAQPLEKPNELSWWDWAVFLLHTVAEIEHALMVQYLYAAYSLSDHPTVSDHPTGPVPTNPATVTAGWRNTIITIAREDRKSVV